MGPPVLLLFITSAQKIEPPVESGTSAASVLMVKVNGVEHWLDPPLELQLMAMPFVNLNVLPLAAGAWINPVLTVSAAPPLLGVPFNTLYWPLVVFQPFDDVFVMVSGPRALPKPKFKAPPLPLAPVLTKAQPGASVTEKVVVPA